MTKLLQLLLLTALSATAADLQYRIAEAKDAGGNLLYRELHQLQWNGDKLRQTTVVYEAPDGRILGAMRSDFAASPSQPETLFVTANAVESYQVRRAPNDRILVSYRDDNGVESKTMPIPKNAVFGQGFSYGITAKIDGWQTRDKARLDFLMPGRFDYFRFDLIATERRDNQQLFRLRVSNLVYRLFIDEIAMAHDVESGLLTAYAGPSNVVFDKEGKPLEVSISYRDSSGEDFAAAVAGAEELLARPL